MSRIPSSAAVDHTLTVRDRDWISHVLPKENLEVPRDHLPDPDTENLPSSTTREESAVELERRWTDVGIERISLNYNPRRV